MNTTIIRADEKTRMEIMKVVCHKINRASRPVVTFLNDAEDNELVICGCSTTEIASAISGRLGKKIVFIKASN